MNKKILLKLIADAEFAYLSFRRQADANTVSAQWGMGILEPYSLEPYAIEFMGFSRGKMLKKSSVPGRNRYRYSLDAAGRIIYSIAYASLGGPEGSESWIHNDDFYEHHDDHVIHYRFSDVFEDASDTRLSAVTWVSLENGKVIKSFGLGNSNLSHYTEQTYTYDRDELIGMRLCWPEGPYPDRNFRVFHNAKTIRIVELGVEGKEDVEIYPSHM